MVCTRVGTKPNPLREILAPLVLATSPFIRHTEKNTRNVRVNWFIWGLFSWICIRMLGTSKKYSPKWWWKMVFKHGTKKQIQVLCLAAPFSGRANKIFKLWKKKTPYPESEQKHRNLLGIFFGVFKKKHHYWSNCGLFQKSIHLSGLPQVPSKQRSLIKKKPCEKSRDVTFFFCFEIGESKRSLYEEGCPSAQQSSTQQ